MSCDIERVLQQMQAEHTGEHLPLEDILAALHEEEVAESFLLRDFGGVPLFPRRAEDLPRKRGKRTHGCCEG